MVEQFVLQKLMEFNIEMSSVSLSCSETSSCDGRNCSMDNGTGLPEADKPEVVEVIDENEKNKPRRTLRKRIRPPDKVKKSGDSTKVQKMSNNVGDIQKYYLSKKVSRLHPTLETIFEIPKEHDNKQQYVSTKKFKRTIQFSEDAAVASTLKLRKRQQKAKKLPFSKSFLNRKKVSMDTLLKKLSGIDSDRE